MPLVTLDKALAQPFDYIIIGGGTAGLVVASRLSEDPEVSVLVLDAGNPNLNDPLITRGNQWGSQFGNPRYDWAFKTAPQKHMNGKEFIWSRGKSLGGSSAMNFQLWSLPPKGDINAWEKLGNKGWNWGTYEKYHSKAATYVPIDATTRTDAKSLKATWDLETRSNGAGPLFVTHPKLKFEIDYKAHDVRMRSATLL
ncbi:hypothetical protein PM082_006479 [Marasmius tenuissimus]|nr:hypothetical protein PM082_006479 [Marasmius tenuissimus]